MREPRVLGVVALWALASLRDGFALGALICF